MQARKELVKKVAQAIEEEGNKPSSFYNFDNILDNFKLRHDCDMERLHSVMICCPFHADEDPSLLYKYDTKSWFCFGCQKSGDILQFLVELDKIGNNASCTRASKANSILKEDLNIRKIAGIETVYAKEADLKQFDEIPLKRRKFSCSSSVTFNSVADKILKKNDYSLIEKAVLMMQKGFTPDLIEEGIFKTTTKKQYSIEEMWS